MKMIELRNLVLKRLDKCLSDEEMKELTVEINHIITLLAKDMNMPKSALFLLTDDQKLPDSLQDYLKTTFGKK